MSMSFSSGTQVSLVPPLVAGGVLDRDVEPQVIPGMRVVRQLEQLAQHGQKADSPFMVANFECRALGRKHPAREPQRRAPPELVAALCGQPDHREGPA